MSNLIQQKELKERLDNTEEALHLACDVIRQYVQIVYNDNVDKLPNLTNLEDYYLQTATYGVFKGDEYRIYTGKAEERLKRKQEK